LGGKKLIPINKKAWDRFNEEKAKEEEKAKNKGAAKKDQPKKN
jgi:hypothetical protein